MRPVAARGNRGPALALRRKEPRGRYNQRERRLVSEVFLLTADSAPMAPEECNQ